MTFKLILLLIVTKLFTVNMWTQRLMYINTGYRILNQFVRQAVFFYPISEL